MSNKQRDDAQLCFFYSIIFCYAALVEYQKRHEQEQTVIKLVDWLIGV